jgi:hypothetical protein
MDAITETRKTWLAAVVAMSLLACAPAYAQQAQPTPKDDSESKPVTDASKADESSIAKESQNPIGNLTILPFENYTNFGFGPHKGTQDVLQFEPVVPFHITPDWNLIARAIIPAVWNPSLSPAPSVPQGIGPTDFSAFFSPSHPVNGWTWGVGPIVQIPTISSPTLGSNVWGVGPTAVVVKTEGPIVAGLLVNNVFSLGGTSGPGGTRYAKFLAQPFFNYNFDNGWFVGTAPIITANEYGSGQRWTLPIGAVAGRVIRLGKIPIKLSLGAYYNAVTPQYGAKWTIQTVVAVIF